MYGRVQGLGLRGENERRKYFWFHYALQEKKKQIEKKSQNARRPRLHFLYPISEVPLQHN